MKKNKFILGLILGIFLIGLVSAGITGYSVALRKGVAVSDDNLGIVSVQKVSGDRATFQFTNPNTGRAETLSGTAGQTLTTSSGTQFEVATVTSGNVFKRGEARINVVPEDASSVAKIATGAGAVTGHTHLSDYKFFKGNLTSMSNNTLLVGIVNCKSQFGQDYVVLGGGYEILGALEKGMITNGPNNGETYEVVLNILAQGDPSGNIFATCARVEPTLHQFSQDY